MRRFLHSGTWLRWMEKIKILLEYGGSRRPLSVTRNGCLCNVIERELEKLGCPDPTDPTVQLSAVEVSASEAPSTFLLQRWSTSWNGFVDVETIDDIENHDRLTVVRAPSSQQVLLLCQYYLCGWTRCGYQLHFLLTSCVNHAQILYVYTYLSYCLLHMVYVCN